MITQPESEKQLDQVLGYDELVEKNKESEIKIAQKDQIIAEYDKLIAEYNKLIAEKDKRIAKLKEEKKELINKTTNY